MFLFKKEEEEERKRCYWLLRMTQTWHPSFRSSFHKIGLILYSRWFSFLLPWPFPHLSSASSVTCSTHTHILQLLKVILGAQCILPCPSNEILFAIIFAQQHIWLDAYLFTLLTHPNHVDWKTFSYQIQESGFRMAFENGDMLQTNSQCHFLESCARLSLSSRAKIRMDDM